MLPVVGIWLFVGFFGMMNAQVPRMMEINEMVESLATAESSEAVTGVTSGESSEITTVVTARESSEAIAGITSGESSEIITVVPAGESSEITPEVTFEAISRATASAQSASTDHTCEPFVKCAFQVYEMIERPDGTVSGKSRTGAYVKYCNCPEGQVCTEVGENMKMRYFYNKCLNITSEPESNMTTEEMTSENSSTLISNSTVLQMNETTAEPLMHRIGLVRDDL